MKNNIKRIHPKDFVDSWKRGHNDCTVNALASSTGLSYGDAFTFAKSCGRKDRKGIRSEVLINNWNNQSSIDKRFTQVLSRYNDKGITAGQFCKLFPKGSYYVRKTKHAFAVVDGQVVDTHVGPKVRITDAWAYGSAPKAPIERKVVKQTVNSRETVETAGFNKEQFILEYKATGKPKQKKIPCILTGQMITMFGDNLHKRVKQYGSVEALLENFVCKGAHKIRQRASLYI